MVDQVADIELGVRLEEEKAHPVLGFMRSFVDEMVEPSAEMEDWEVDRHRELEKRTVGQKLDRFVGWFRDTWHEVEAGNAIPDRQFQEQVVEENINGKPVVKHEPTGLQVFIGPRENSFKARSRLQDQVMEQFGVWRQAGSPLADLGRYRDGLMAEAAARLG